MSEIYLNPIQPKIYNQSVSFEELPDTAQYGESSFENVIDVRRGISLAQAKKIAESNPSIDYFVRVRNRCTMLLVAQRGVEYNSENDPFGLVQLTEFWGDDGLFHRLNCRYFESGDTVFFKNDGKWLAGAPGLANTYNVHRGE